MPGHDPYFAYGAAPDTIQERKDSIMTTRTATMIEPYLFADGRRDENILDQGVDETA